MAEERIKYTVTTEGTDTAAKNFDTLSGSIDKTQRFSIDATTATSNLAGAVGNVGTVVASANPQLGAFAGVIGTAGSSVSALTAVLGGPLGIAAGGLIAAIGLYVAKTTMASDAAEKQTNALERQKQTVADLASEFARLNSALTAQQAQVAALQFLTEGAGSSGTSSREKRRLSVLLQLARERQGRTDVEESNRAALAEINRSESEAAALGVFGEGGAAPRRAGATAGGVAEFTAQQQRVDRALAASRRRSAFLGRVQTVRDEGQVEAARASAMARADAEIESFDRVAERRAEEQRAWEQYNASIESSSKARIDAVTASMMTFGEQGTEAFVRLAAGQEDAAAAIIAGIGDQMVAEGSRYAFRGGLELLAGNPAGGAMAALGAAEIAAGLALGAAVRPSGGSGAGGVAPAEPARIRDSRDDGGTRVVNVRVDAMVADANAGRRISQAVRESERIYGRAG